MTREPAKVARRSHDRRIAVVGLGYVGLPVAAAFARHSPVVAFDCDGVRIAELRRGHDRNATVARERLADPHLELTGEAAELARADFIIVAVPTPIDEARHPDLRFLEAATRTVGAHLRRGAIVVYESTVYPGATESVCIPLLETVSGLRAGSDFFFGYSPERINPGDAAHDLARVVKVVSGCDPETLDTVAAVYESVVEAGVHRAPSIRVAEAAKVIENTQRDINIALMNEIAMILEKLELDTGDVLAAAGTKWNFLPFQPGLVGGHCIGVDPYYLTHEALRHGHHPEVILAGRRINDEIGAFVAASVVRLLVREGAVVKGTRVTVLGAAFKENVPDVRNSGVGRLVRELARYDLRVQVHDPIADPAAAHAEFGFDLVERAALRPARVAVLAVAHDAWRRNDPWELVTSVLQEGEGVVADVTRRLAREHTPAGVRLWRL